MELSNPEVSTKYTLWKELDIDDLTLDLIFSQLKELNKKSNIYPSRDKVFKAFEVPYSEVKVIILGQSPYHTKYVADGLAFSSGKPLYCPPSLKVILKEVEDDVYNGLNLDRTSNYSLEDWSKQGVLLLNTTLTVSEGNPEGHNIWEPFIDKVINTLNKKDKLVWMLWGSDAKAYKIKINHSHLILEASHPMTEVYGSGGFYKQKHFSKCNSYLKGNYGTEIIW